MLRVTDNGCGLPADLGDRIFTPFVTMKELGLGLGLSICKRIVEAHGGSIAAANRAEGGAVFTIRLPPPEGSLNRDPMESATPPRSASTSRLNGWRRHAETARGGRRAQRPLLHRESLTVGRPGSRRGLDRPGGDRAGAATARRTR